MTNPEIIERVLDAEGRDKYVENPDPTKWGITGGGLAEKLGRIPTTEEIRALTHEDAVAFYEWLLEHSRIGRIVNDDLRWLVFDAAVHLGHGQAIKLLQRSLGLKDDGVIGSVTLAALPHLDASRLVLRFLAAQVRFYTLLATTKKEDRDKNGIPDQLQWNPGYMNRVAEKMEALT